MSVPRAVAGVPLAAMLYAASVAALTLDELTRALQSVPERHASFEETKHVALIDGPLVRRGTFDYMRPDRLQMRVDAPYFERLEIRGDALAIERRSGTTRVALSAQPALAAWIESLRATLAGDRPALEAHFAVSVAGTLADWRLTLVPREAALAALVARVTIAGRASEVVRFEIDETRGDTTAIVITPARPR